MEFPLLCPGNTGHIEPKDYDGKLPEIFAYGKALLSPEEVSFTAEAAMVRAICCFDLSEVAPILAENIGRESVLLLSEILNRIEVPALDYIPNRDEVRRDELERWYIPLSGITLHRVSEGDRKNEFLFTPETVNNVTLILLHGLFLILLSWTVYVVCNIVMHAIITAGRNKDNLLNTDFINLLFRVISTILIFAIWYWGGLNFGLPVNAVFASAGIAGVALALAARESLANFFGGISILFDGPFKTGDFIVLDTGERGEVKSIGMRSTRLLTLDGILITIPNSVITNAKVVNESAPYPHFRVRVAVGVAYGSDLDLVETVLTAQRHLGCPLPYTGTCGSRNDDSHWS